LLFAVFSLLGTHIGPTTNTNIVTNPERAGAEVNKAIRLNLDELRALQEKRQKLAAARQPTTNIDADIREKQSEIAIEERISRGFIPERDAIATVDATPSADGNLSFSSGSQSIDEWLRHVIDKTKENPKLLIYKLQSSAYKFSWLLIPISIPLVWLLFLHRRRYRQEFTAYDHTVFVTYSIAFMSLALIAISLLSWVGLPAGIVSLAVLTVPPLHIYRQLKGAYGLSRWSAFWRTGVLLVLSFFALTLFALLLLTLGVFG